MDRAVKAAREAFADGRWRSLWIPERVAILNRLADLIEADMDELVALEVAQTGTAIKFRRDNDMPFAPDNLRFFATAIRHLDGKAAGEYSTNHTSMVRREPIGVCGQIAPWNYPFMMAIWKIGPALAAGNSVVLKPASATPLTTLRLGQLALDAGLPPGVLNVITGPGEVVGAAIAGHPDIDLVSLTGDTATGKKIAEQAAGNLKRLHLELGGKAPFIVYADADLDAAARGAVAGGYINAGQDCTAATRIYVERSVYEPFLASAQGIRRQRPRRRSRGPVHGHGLAHQRRPGAAGRGLRGAGEGGRCTGDQRRRPCASCRVSRAAPSTRPRCSRMSTRTPSVSSRRSSGPS